MRKSRGFFDAPKAGYFEKRARRANRAKVTRILSRVGKGNPPVEGDKLPPGLIAKKAKLKK